MPSWLWRAWLGPAGRGPRGLLGRRPRRRLLLPPPPEGLPCPCPCPDDPAFIVLSNRLGRVFVPVQGGKISRCPVPHWVAAGSHRVGAKPLFLRGLTTCSVTPLSHIRQTIKFRDRTFEGAQPTFHAELRVGLERNRDRPLSGDTNSH